MVVFGKSYAESYDQIYKSKAYVEECDYVLNLAKSAATTPISNILDLGCGTGTHALEFARRGFTVDGVDISAYMLELAKAKAKDQGLVVNFYELDMSNFSFDKRFELAVAFFAVVGYLVETDKLVKFFKNVFAHLCEGGVFVFDCWHGNAVLYEKPITRMLSFIKDGRSVYRLSETQLDINHNLASVNFTLIDVNAIDPKSRLILEKHQMRYFFIPELKYLLELAGFKDISFFKFMSNEPLQCSDWNMCVLAKK